MRIENKLPIETVNLKKQNRKAVLACLFLFLTFLWNTSVNAQCSMCRAALESEGNGVKAEAVNDGIVYLMVIPYVLVAVIGYFVYKTGKK